MPPRASLKGRISTWLRIIGLQFRAMPGANQAPEPIQRRFKAPKIARKTRSTCQSLTTFWANPLQYLLCSVETRRTVEVYLKQYHAFSCCRKSSFWSRKEIPVSTRVVTVVILALTFLLLAFGAQQTAKIPRVGFSRTAGLFFAPLRRIPARPCRLRIRDGHNITP
jgi:hypothetical protein